MGGTVQVAAAPETQHLNLWGQMWGQMAALPAAKKMDLAPFEAKSLILMVGVKGFEQ